jgi:hypothetical protein
MVFIVKKNLGGDFGLSGRRLGPMLETLAKESGLPNSVFTRVVQASFASMESLKTLAGDSATCQLGAGDSSPYRPETLETLALIG